MSTRLRLRARRVVELAQLSAWQRTRQDLALAQAQRRLDQTADDVAQARRQRDDVESAWRRAASAPRLDLSAIIAWAAACQNASAELARHAGRHDAAQTAHALAVAHWRAAVARSTTTRSHADAQLKRLDRALEQRRTDDLEDRQSRGAATP